MFMEAAQGDRRINVMQAPKLTLFNGQTATIDDDQDVRVPGDQRVRSMSVNGQIVFIPTEHPAGRASVATTAVTSTS